MATRRSCTSTVWVRDLFPALTPKVCRPPRETRPGQTCWFRKTVSVPNILSRQRSRTRRPSTAGCWTKGCVRGGSSSLDRRGRRHALDRGQHATHVPDLLRRDARGQRRGGDDRNPDSYSPVVKRSVRAGSPCDGPQGPDLVTRAASRLPWGSGREWSALSLWERMSQALRGLVTTV
jgi:hypothetical protein